MILEAPPPPPPASLVAPVLRGAKSGPLSYLIPVFLDFETKMTKTVNLNCMRLREYLAQTYITYLSLAIGFDDPVEVFKYKPNEDSYPQLTALLTELATDPRYVFIAHNAPFDIRVMRFKLGVPHPIHVWCSLEGAMAAWPELPGGYGLGQIAETLEFPENLRKLEIDLREGHHTEEEMTAYNRRDTEVGREVYVRQIARIPEREQWVGLGTQRQRRLYLLVNERRLDDLEKQLAASATEAEREAAKYLTDDERLNVFNHGEEDRAKARKRAIRLGLELPPEDEETQALKSIRSRRFLKILQTKYSAEINTTSVKKLSPLVGAKNPQAWACMTEAGRANKMMTHMRNSTKFRGAVEVDVELGYARAHTFRFSSPSTGRGLNLHNVPKRDIDIARPIRQTFRLPPDKVAVRGDLANVEYRVNGWLTNCQTIIKMFDPALGGNIFTDPYMAGWKSMTGVDLKSKKDPIRQVSKSATLGLGFCMSAARYVGELLKVLADKKSGVTEQGLRELVVSRNWELPPPGPLKFIVQRTGCNDLIATCAWHIHRLFNKAHPEFREVAGWLVSVIEAVAAVGHDFDLAQQTIDRWYLASAAPNRDKIDLSIDSDRSRATCSVRARCGPWVETVCWREPKLRPTNYFNGAATDFKLTIRKAYGPPKIFTPSLAIENITQAAARNMLCEGILRLEKMGWMDYIHVHDELMLIVDRNPKAVLAARDAILDVFGPKGKSSMGWAILIKPDEVTVTESLYEDEDDLKPIYGKKADGTKDENLIIRPGRWDMIEQGHPEALLHLP